MTIRDSTFVIRHLIWDVDGTLFDTYPAMAAAMRAALADFDVDEPADRLEALTRVSVGHCTSTMAELHGLDEEEIVRSFLAHYDRARPEDQPPFPDVREICADIGAAGGVNVIVTHRRRATTDALLATHGMTRYFAGRITADDGFPRKPDPAAFIAALTAFDLPPPQTMTVGDRSIDILGGQAAGVHTCLFGPPVEGLTPDLIVADFAALRTYLVRHGLPETRHAD